MQIGCHHQWRYRRLLSHTLRWLQHCLPRLMNAKKRGNVIRGSHQHPYLLNLDFQGNRFWRNNDWTTRIWKWNPSSYRNGYMVKQHQQLSFYQENTTWLSFFFFFFTLFKRYHTAPFFLLFPSLSSNAYHFSGNTYTHISVFSFSFFSLRLEMDDTDTLAAVYFIL